MLARLCLTLSILLAGGSTLPNGIHVYELSQSGKDINSFEVVAGYRTGVHNQAMGTSSLADAISTFLKTSSSVRAMAVAAYGAGGDIEFFSDLDRAGFRLKMPNWARPMVEESISEFFSETPQKSTQLVDRVLLAMPESISDVRSNMEERFRAALLGPRSKPDQGPITRDTVNQFFAANYGTDRAFVLMSGTPEKSLQSVEQRKSEVTDVPNGETAPVTAVAPFLIQSDLENGAVILGSPVPSVYFQSWYSYLMLDRLIQQTIPEKPVTALLPALDSYYYRMEVAVPSGQMAESVEKSLHQELEQLQFVRASNEQLDAARRNAIQYLDSEAVQQWFVSLGIPERRLEGLEWLKAFTADDMRSTARDLIESNPVIVGWSPKVKVVRLDVERLSDIAARSGTASTKSLPALGPVKVVAFPPHTDAVFAEQAPIRLESGVSVLASSAYAVFVAPDQLKVFDQEPALDVIQSSFGAYRASRILVMAPPASLDRAKQQWARFQGNVRDQKEVPISGKITSADIPALFVLKMMLDRRLIEAGLWNAVQLEIRVSEGSTLAIHGSDADRHTVTGWIAEIASHPIAETDMNWAREAAIHHLPEFRPDLQSLAWQWNPEGALINIRAIPALQVQDLARIYLQ